VCVRRGVMQWLRTATTNKIINIIQACTYTYIQLHVLSNNSVNMKLGMNKKVTFQEKSSTLIKQQLWLARTWSARGERRAGMMRTLHLRTRPLIIR
jgi:hypothetical protein